MAVAWALRWDSGAQTQAVQMTSWATAGRNSSHFTSIQSSNKSACHGLVQGRR